MFKMEPEEASQNKISNLQMWFMVIAALIACAIIISAILGIVGTIISFVIGAIVLVLGAILTLVIHHPILAAIVIGLMIWGSKNAAKIEKR